MADEEEPSSAPTGGAGPAGAPPGDKKAADARRQRILVGTGVAGLILTFILVRRSSANSAAANTASANSGIDPNTGVPYSAEVSSLEQQLAGAAGGLGLTGYSGTGGAPASTNTTTTTTNNYYTQGGAPTGPAGGPANGFNNPYPVGTDVGIHGEMIVESVWDPAVHAYLDLTNQGGIYAPALGGGDLGISGSAYGKGTFGSSGLTVDGQTFTETDSKGHKYTYKA